EVEPSAVVAINRVGGLMEYFPTHGKIVGHLSLDQQTREPKILVTCAALVDPIAAAAGLLQDGPEATQFACAANHLTVAGSIATPFTKLDEVEQMKKLEDSSLDFYTMLRSVVAQKRQAELDEAVARSGWTALRNSKAAPRTSSRPSRPASKNKAR